MFVCADSSLFQAGFESAHCNLYHPQKPSIKSYATTIHRLANKITASAVPNEATKINSAAFCSRNAAFCSRNSSISVFMVKPRVPAVQSELPAH